MNDDEVWDAMRQTVSPARLDRPVEDILRRGRARRRNRTAFGVAGGGLAAFAAVAAVAFALPSAGGQPTEAPTAAAAGPVKSTAPVEMEPVGWTLSKAPDSKVKLTLSSKQIQDPEALQRALAGAGIPAAVKTHVRCVPRNAELPQADQVYRAEVRAPDYKFEFIITPTKMPKGSRLYFSLFHPLDPEKLGKVDVALVSKDDPMICKRMG